MTSITKALYGILGPPKSQPRTQDFETIRGSNGSGRKGRGEKVCIEPLTNLSLNEETRNGDELILENKTSPKERNITGNNVIIFC